MKKHILIIGATGMIGQAVTRQMRNDGFAVRVLTRNKSKANQFLGKPQTGMRDFLELYREQISNGKSKMIETMTGKTVKLLVLIALLVHGIGHIQGVISGIGVKFSSHTNNISWLLKGMGETPNRALCIILYLGAAITGILAGLGTRGILIPESSWPVFALISALFSTLSLALFPRALAMFFNKAGAIAVNLVIFYSILLQGHWPAALFEE